MKSTDWLTLLETKFAYCFQLQSSLLQTKHVIGLWVQHLPQSLDLQFKNILIHHHILQTKHTLNNTVITVLQFLGCLSPSTWVILTCLFRMIFLSSFSELSLYRFSSSILLVRSHFSLPDFSQSLFTRRISSWNDRKEKTSQCMMSHQFWIPP